jgi:hypothetical protein
MYLTGHWTTVLLSPPSIILLSMVSVIYIPARPENIRWKFLEIKNS